MESRVTHKLFVSIIVILFSFSVIKTKTEAKTIEEIILSSLNENTSSELNDDNISENLSDTVVNEAEQLFLNLGTPDFPPTAVNKVFAPRVFFGYRNIQKEPLQFRTIELLKNYPVMTNDSISEFINETYEEILENNTLENDSVSLDNSVIFIPSPLPNQISENGLDIFNAEKLPKWLDDALRSYRFQDDFVYYAMIKNPDLIEYAYWDLPEPPRLLPDDVSFKAYIRKLNLPEIDLDKAVLPEEEMKKTYWLHTFNTLLQFSQAYVSPNWYQGGNNYLALLFNFNWNVQLNQVYHPNVLFQSNFQYKLALSSNPKGQLHKYTISEDALQYNLNTGIKAYGNWFYSLNLLFKTQLLNNYEEDSFVRTASFLSPGDLNLGLGMSYSRQNKYKTFQLTLAISPLSYNLKTCISDKVDHEQFNIKPWKKTKSEVGSNVELNMSWNITSNISYKTRLFTFSNYKYFLADWENTFSFNINKFLSTQLFLHLRYDGSTENYGKWKKFMMREILSFGLSYTFATKP